MRNKAANLLFSLLAIGSGFLVCHAQTSDILRLEYTIIPRDDSQIQVARYRLALNLPIKVGEERYFVVGSEYNQVAFNSREALPFDDSQLNRLHVIDLNLGYIFKLNDNWRLISVATPRLASNFTDGVVGRDFKLNLAATLWKERMDADKPFRIILGLTYNSTTGLPVPLPLINYTRRFHPDWSFVLGVPRNSLRYHLGKKHMFQTALFLDGYFVNIQNDIVLPDDSLASSISLSALIGALGYQYSITKNMSVYLLSGYALTQKGLLRDDKRMNVYVLNDKGNIYFRTGFKIGIF